MGVAEPFCTEHSVRLHDDQMPWVLQHKAADGYEVVLVDMRLLPMPHRDRCTRPGQNNYEISTPAHLECPTCHTPEMKVVQHWWHGNDLMRAEVQLELALAQQIADAQ